MATVERIETFLVDLPTIRPHQLAMTTMRGQTLMLVQIHCSDGTVGIGEGTTIGGLAYSEESPESMKLTVDTYVAPLLIGANANHVPALMATLNRDITGNRFTKSAIETALYDALGQRYGLPISELLGGRVRDHLEVAWTLASGDTQKDIAEAEEMLETRRHRIFKLKIGRRSVADDVAHVGAIKRALGDRGEVRVDINMAWSELEAREGMAALADVGCTLAEQPVQTKAAMQAIAKRFPIALMADELLTGPRSAMELAAAQCADVFAVKIEQAGGLRAAQQIAAIAQAQGIGLYGGTMLEGAISTMASAHVFSTFEQLDWGTELFGPLLITEEILQEPLCYEDFGLRLPNAPGLGIKLDDDKVRYHTRKESGGRTVVSMS
ncbi:MAG TPA: muconate/chloromuconate family cycloisomerase [Paenalcaligenes sp.]|nr:muconate/chloromuconate family cycloisomerase [Paenalcaligenes sp.]